MKEDEAKPSSTAVLRILFCFFLQFVKTMCIRDYESQFGEHSRVFMRLREV